MTTIHAENLKKGDVIHIPASSISNPKYFLVAINEPKVNTNTVHVWLHPIKNGMLNTDKVIEKDYGRKVDLEITE